MSPPTQRRATGALAALAAAIALLVGSADSSADLVPPPPTSPPPQSAAWVDWDALLDSVTAYAVREWNGRTYLVVQPELGQLDYAPMPECFGADGCTEPVAFPDHDGFPAAHATSLRVITPIGPCAPTVGDPVMLDTSSACGPAITVARPIDGCGDAIAPIAIAGSELPALTWHARTEQRYNLDQSAITDAELRDWTGEQIAHHGAVSWELAASANRGEAVRWDVALPHESLKTLAAGFQDVGPDEPCSVTGVAWMQTTLHVRGTPHPLSLSEALGGIPWAGVIGFDGHIAALVGQGRDEVALLVRHADGRLETAARLAWLRLDPACDGPDMPGVYAAPCR